MGYQAKDALRTGRVGDRGALWWELLPSSGLTEGHQRFGCLRRNLKNGCIARSEGKEPAPLTERQATEISSPPGATGPGSAWVLPGSSA